MKSLWLGLGVGLCMSFNTYASSDNLHAQDTTLLELPSADILQKFIKEEFGNDFAKEFDFKEIEHCTVERDFFLMQLLRAFEEAQAKNCI